MSARLGAASRALHALLASSGVVTIADALIKLHGMAQATGSGVGIAALAAAAVSWAKHSREVDVFAHQLELDASKVVTPQVVDRVRSLETAVGHNLETLTALLDTAERVPVVEKAVVDARAEIERVEAEIPVSVKTDISDLRPLVVEILGPLAKLLPEPAAAEPDPESAPSAGPVAAPETTA